MSPVDAMRDVGAPVSVPSGRSLSFSGAEYGRRFDAAQAAVAAGNLDAFVSTTLGNICWLTGFQTMASYGFALYAAIVRPGRPPILFSSDFESHNAVLDSWVEDVVTYEVMADPVAALAGVLRSRGLAAARIGIETGHGAATAAETKALQVALPHADVVDASGTIERLRSVKSPEELAALRLAARTSSAGMAAALGAVREGATENDVAAAASEAVIRHGGEHFSIVPIVTAGRRSGIPHSTFRRTRIGRGDPIFIEVCGTWSRYSAPMLRTATVGEPSAAIRRAHDACRASVETIIAEARAGVLAREVARQAGAAMRRIEPSLVWHGYFGGSCGLSFSPSYSDGGAAEITDRTDVVLETGMTFHASTSLRKLGEFGVTVGDTIAITDGGCEVLTSGSPELRVVDA